MKISDVAGLYLKDALEVLKNNNIEEFDLKMTLAPKETYSTFDDMCRVVRLRMNGENRLELLVCRPL